jgi:hypothetical protein
LVISFLANFHGVVQVLKRLPGVWDSGIQTKNDEVRKMLKTEQKVFVCMINKICTMPFDSNGMEFKKQWEFRKDSPMFREPEIREFPVSQMKARWR